MASKREYYKRKTQNDYYVKCDNGFIATIRKGTDMYELEQLDEWNGLSKYKCKRCNQIEIEFLRRGYCSYDCEIGR